MTEQDTRPVEPDIPGRTQDESFMLAKGFSALMTDVGFVSREAHLDQYEPRLEHGLDITTSYDQLIREIHYDEDNNPLFAYQLRDAPVGEIVDCFLRAGVISKGLEESGILREKFAPDELVKCDDGVIRRVGGLRHVFLGDWTGGPHDIDTPYDAKVAGDHSDTRVIGISRKQRIDGGEALDIRAGHPRDEDGDGKTDRVDLKTHKSKDQFPEEWSTDDVILALVEVSETEPVKTMDNGNNKHEGFVNGVPIVVVTDSSRRIITGHPNGAVALSKAA